MADLPQPTSAIRKVRKAVLPAAGLGTRFLPATKAQPKEMLTVVDKPQIQYVVEECVASGIEHIIIVTGKGKNSIEDHFDHAPTLERFLEEKGKPEQAAMVRRSATRAMPRIFRGTCERPIPAGSRARWRCRGADQRSAADRSPRQRYCGRAPPCRDRHR